MATDLEKLVVQLSADFKGFEKAMARANGVTNKQFNAIERRARKMNKNLDGIFAKSFRGLAAPMAGIGAALGTREIINLTNAWTDLNSSVALYAGGAEQGRDVLERLGEVARRTYTDLHQAAEVYIQNANTMRELGYNADQTFNFVESLNYALDISGARGQRAETIMGALSKAMAHGSLQGQNLNTIIQQGGRVAEALADGLGVTTVELRKLGIEGKITTSKMIEALSSQMGKMRKEAEAMPPSIADGVRLLQNALLEYVGNADNAAGISGRISSALEILADNFDKTADVALQLAGVLAGAILGRSILKMVTTLGLGSAALVKFTRALAAARTMAGLATAFGGVAAAAGPVGMIIGGAVVSSLILYSTRSSEAAAGADRFAARLEALKGKAEESADAVEEAGKRTNEALKNALGQEVDAAAKALEEAKAAALDLLNVFIDDASPRSEFAAEHIKSLEQLRDRLDDNVGSAETVKQALYKLANSNPDFQWLADALNPLLEKLALVAQGARDATAELEAVSNSRGPSHRQAEDESMGKYIQMRDEGTAWEREQLRRAKLGKDQLALENEIAKARKEADEAGIFRTDEQIKRLAEARIAGDAARSKEGKKPKKERDDEYERLTKRINENIAVMQAENAVLASMNPLVNDYGYALEKARVQQELLTAAKRAGVEVTPELEREIEALADTYALATVEAEKLTEKHDEIRESAEAALATARDVTQGLIDGFIEGKSAADIMANALKKIGNHLINDVLNNLFKIQNMGGGGGGFLSGLLGMFGGGGGGINYGALSASGKYLFSSGGYTGPGPKNKPAGVVHAGEVVWSQDDIRRAGGVAAVEAMRKGAGSVAMPSFSAPAMPKMAAGGASGQQIIVHFAPQIDASGADPAAIQRLEGGLQKLKAEIPAQVIQGVRKAQQSNVKLG